MSDETKKSEETQEPAGKNTEISDKELDGVVGGTATRRPNNTAQYN